MGMFDSMLASMGQQRPQQSQGNAWGIERPPDQLMPMQRPMGPSPEMIARMQQMPQVPQGMPMAERGPNALMGQYGQAPPQQMMGQMRPQMPPPQMNMRPQMPQMRAQPPMQMQPRPQMQRPQVQPQRPMPMQSQGQGGMQRQQPSRMFGQK